MSGPKRSGNGKSRKRTPQRAPSTRANGNRNVALAGAGSAAGARGRQRPAYDDASARYTTTRESANSAPPRHDALLAVEPEDRAAAAASPIASTSAVEPLAPPQPPAFDDAPVEDAPIEDVAAEPSAAASPIEEVREPEAPPAGDDGSERLRWRPRLDRGNLARRGRYLAGATWTKLRGYTPEQYLWFGVLFLAALLRFWDLGAKPLHHDESMHAYFSLQFALDPASYSYLPLLHGPFQFHAEGIVFAILIGLEHLLGQARSWGDPWINDTTARILPALFGLGIVALPIWLRRELGRAGALLTAFLLAVSPAFVYFSRFLREDIYFNFFMFLMVVAAVRYARERTLRWFVTLFVATVLAYCTFEGIFLTLAIFFGFLALLVLWELAHSVAQALPRTLTSRERAFFSRAGLLCLAGGLAAIGAHVGLQTLNSLSDAINKNPGASDAFVKRLEDQTVAVILYGSIVIALVVIGTLFWQMYRDDVLYAAEMAHAHAVDADSPFDEGLDSAEEAPPPAYTRVERLDRVLSAPGRAKASLRARLDPHEQPFLRLLLGISWVQWFVAFVAGWMLFAALFWILPGDGHSIGQGFQQGIGQGVWQGIYYWIQQQKVARGGQPWYYYLLLFPLYEQVACVFGVAGIIYALARPSRFRLFLVWWFAASLFLYSWAGEKMPWLSIHILLPLMLLSGIALAAVLRGCVALVREIATGAFPPPWLASWRTSRELSWLAIASLCVVLFFVAELVTGKSAVLLPLLALSLAALIVALVRAGIFRPTAAVLGAAIALLLFIPTIHGMLVLTYQDPANGPHEMMVYVQTTPDVETVMRKIQQADQALYGGKHLLKIGIGPGQEWPFYWYIQRQYPNAMFGYRASDPNEPQMDVLILSTPGDGLNSADVSDTFMALHPNEYRAKEYVLRSWWDEAYKPPPCVATKTNPCPPSANWGSGVGLGPYLSYGSNPPKNAQFNAGLAAGRLWSWLWYRQPLGAVSTTYYDFVFIVRDGVPIQP